MVIGDKVRLINYRDDSFAAYRAPISVLILPQLIRHRKYFLIELLHFIRPGNWLPLASHITLRRHNKLERVQFCATATVVV